eukprot:TRINITY_DN803_c0_g1_i5.p1 TRINITY_DN803_c0_g1~~TRINITY_DN803_c0_g1_i5.p1  ORF type:complete len:1040 (+),score=340.86 TRINITY_DN803_c0_g1_i5:31-3150(+)
MSTTNIGGSIYGTQSGQPTVPYPATGTPPPRPKDPAPKTLPYPSTPTMNRATSLSSNSNSTTPARPVSTNVNPSIYNTMPVNRTTPTTPVPLPPPKKSKTVGKAELVGQELRIFDPKHLNVLSEVIHLKPGLELEKRIDKKKYQLVLKNAAKKTLCKLSFFKIDERDAWFDAVWKAAQSLTNNSAPTLNTNPYQTNTTPGTGAPNTPYATNTNTTPTPAPGPGTTPHTPHPPILPRPHSTSNTINPFSAPGANSHPTATNPYPTPNPTYPLPPSAQQTPGQNPTPGQTTTNPTPTNPYPTPNPTYPLPPTAQPTPGQNPAPGQTNPTPTTNPYPTPNPTYPLPPTAHPTPGQNPTPTPGQATTNPTPTNPTPPANQTPANPNPTPGANPPGPINTAASNLYPAHPPATNPYAAPSNPPPTGTANNTATNPFPTQPPATNPYATPSNPPPTGTTSTPTQSPYTTPNTYPNPPQPTNPSQPPATPTTTPTTTPTPATQYPNPYQTNPTPGGQTPTPPAHQYPTPTTTPGPTTTNTPTSTPYATPNNNYPNPPANTNPTTTTGSPAQPQHQAYPNPANPNPMMTNTSPSTYPNPTATSNPALMTNTSPSTYPNPTATSNPALMTNTSPSNYPNPTATNNPAMMTNTSPSTYPNPTATNNPALMTNTNTNTTTTTTNTAANATTYYWLWKDDTGQLIPFDTKTNDTIVAAQKQRLPAKFIHNGRAVTLDFPTMSLYDDQTKSKRSVAWTTKPPQQPTKKPEQFLWDDNGVWKAYPADINKQLNDAYSTAPNTPLNLTIMNTPYIINFSKMEQMNVRTQFVRKMSTESSQRVVNVNVNGWDPYIPIEGQNQNLNLITLSPSDDEYAKVNSLFLKTQPAKRISNIKKIINVRIRKQYLLELDLVKSKYNYDPSIQYVRLLFHGTKNTEPPVIYNGEKGFMMQFAAEGMWGRGTYFAEKSQYSDGYAHTCTDGKQMFLCEVIVGDSHFCPSTQQTREYRLPPEKKVKRGGFENERFDSVSGETGGSKVWIVYENGRAYPTYLITYR